MGSIPVQATKNCNTMKIKGLKFTERGMEIEGDPTENFHKYLEALHKQGEDVDIEGLKKIWKEHNETKKHNTGTEGSDAA